MTSSPISVLVVDDSITVRKHIVEVLSEAHGLTVVGEAADGKQAIELCMKLRPQVVTMDMVLPLMTGVAATEYIMAYCPTPILIVSSSMNRGDLFKTYDALAAGAVDVLEKPRTEEADDPWERRLVAAVRMVARVRVITHLRARLGHRGRPNTVDVPGFETSTTPHRLVAIGASTGGPGAVSTILRSLPADFPLPILLVLHLLEPFARSVGDWLAAQTTLEVRDATDGEPLPVRGRGCVLIAPAGRHLVLSSGRLRLSDTPALHSCRPSVDVLFASLAREVAGSTIGCLLTGMGRDGADGLLSIKQGGGLALVQDEETSVVFGMPGRAVEIGAACRVLPLDQFASTLVRLAESTRAAGGRR